MILTRHSAPTAFTRGLGGEFLSSDVYDLAAEAGCRGDGRERGIARFRTFLSLLIRRQLITLYRQDQARHAADRCSIDDLAEELSVPSEQQDQVDLSWAKAKHEAAVEHVLTKVAMKQQSRQIYRAYVLENRPIDEVSAAFGVTPDIIYKVKNRVNKMIEAVELEYAE